MILKKEIQKRVFLPAPLSRSFLIHGAAQNAKSSK
jgi:hypothetical protein